MSTVAAQADTAQEIARPSVGDEVVWYEAANKHGVCYPARVVRAWDKCLELSVMRGARLMYCGTVHHIDSPIFDENPQFRRFGAWDWPKSYHERKALEAIIEDLARRVDRLEARLGEQSSLKRPGKGIE